MPGGGGGIRQNPNTLEFDRRSRSRRRFTSPSALYPRPSSLNGLVYDTSVTFGMHAAISKQRFL